MTTPTNRQHPIREMDALLREIGLDHISPQDAIKLVQAWDKRRAEVAMSRGAKRLRDVAAGAVL